MTTPPEIRSRIVWDYAPAPESPDHVRLRDSYGLFVDGDFRDPLDGTRVPTLNPATEEPVAEVAFAGPGDVRRAVESARSRGGRRCRDSSAASTCSGSRA
jgi:aldehyde dehydrogenase (NAD+)